MLKKFFTGYVLGLLIFGALFFAISSRLSPSSDFRPQPIDLQGVNIEEISPLD